MRKMVFVLTAAVGLTAAPMAFADCVNFSAARAKAEQDAARRAPLAAADLGMPTLAGLERNIEFIGDPRCGGLTARGPRARYKLTVSFRELITGLYPQIKRQTEKDGQGREWFKNPLVGDRITLTSGTVLDFIGGRSGQGDSRYAEVMITPGTPVGALTTETQPYSIDDIVQWSPWVGGRNGNFVRVNAQAGAGAPAPAENANNKTNTAPGAAAPVASAPSAAQACPPAGNGAANVGAEIGGRALGGGFGRQLGGALGGMLGGGQQKQPQQSGNGQCPR